MIVITQIKVMITIKEPLIKPQQLMIQLLVGGDWLPFLAFSQKYWVANHPNWRTHIFQRGGPTTNQIMSSNHSCLIWLSIVKKFDHSWPWFFTRGFWWILGYPISRQSHFFFILIMMINIETKRSISHYWYIYI